MIINFEGLGGGSPKLKSSAFTEVVYDSSAYTLDFYNIKGEVVESLDCSDFVIDGMVQDVYLSGNTLVIDFNTASGQQDIEIDLTEFINPEMYYTSAQTDTLIASAKTEVYASGTSYTDAAIAQIDLSSAVASANTYTDNAISGVNSHISTVERTTSIALNELHNDIDNIDLSGAVSSAKTYTDAAVISAVTSANSYTDSAKTEVYASGVSYTDAAILSALTPVEHTISTAINELNERVDNIDMSGAVTSAVTSANTYTDTAISGVTAQISTISSQIEEDEQVTSAAINDLLAEIESLKIRVTELEG